MLVEAGDLIIWFLAAFFAFLGLTVTLVLLMWWTKKGGLWGLMVARIKNRGMMVAKIYPSNEVELQFHSNKNSDAVMWDVFDENGTKIDKAPSTIVRTFHTIKGTSMPIHFLPYNYPTNIDLTQKEKSPLKIGETKLLNKISYAGGVLKGMGIKMPDSKGFDMNKAILAALFLVGVLMIIVIVMNWQVLENVAPK